MCFSQTNFDDKNTRAQRKGFDDKNELEEGETYGYGAF